MSGMEVKLIKPPQMSHTCGTCKPCQSAQTSELVSMRKFKSVIYLATCKKCRVQYVGSTSNEFKVRFRNHKSAMLTNKTTCELALHFNRVEHRMSDFIVIEKVVNESEDHNDRRLLTREAFWCSQLCSLHPHGLNKRSEFNSKNRIRFSQYVLCIF